MKKQAPQWFIIPLLSFMVGITVQALSCSWIVTLGVIIGVGSGVFTFSILREKSNSNKKTILLFLLFCVGISQTALQQRLFSHITENYTNKELTLTGTVTDCNPGPINFQTQVTLDIPYSQTIPWLGTLFSVHCIVPAFKKIIVGDVLTLSPLTITKPNNKSFDDFLIKEGILTYVFIPKKTVITISRPGRSLNRYLWQKRQTLYTKIRSLLNFQTSLFYESIFLGNKTHARSAEIGNSFNFWGITYILGRSGLHIGILIIMWQWLFSFVPIPFVAKNILLIFFALTYHLFSWGSLSFSRALLFFLLARQGKLFKQRLTTSHLFIMICFLVLFFNPYQLFTLSFQLSFGIPYALITFCLPKSRIS